MKCKVCNSTEFALNDGVYYCCECMSQVKESRHELTEQEVFSKRSLLRSSSSEREIKPEKEVLYSTWTTTEAYNLIIYEQVSALIKLGASEKLKDVVFYIWSHYLQKCQVAFRKDYCAHEGVPRQSIFPQKRDIRVFYGSKFKEKKRKIKRKKSTSKDDKHPHKNAGDSQMELDFSDVASATSSDVQESQKKAKGVKLSSFASKLQRKIGKKKKYGLAMRTPDHMNLKKTLCFCYLGLLYADRFLLLSDLLRLVEEGSVPYINVIDIFPPTMKLQFEDTSVFNTFAVPDSKEISIMCAKLVDFLQLPKLKNRSLMPIILRFCLDLNLPHRLLPITQSLVSLTNINGEFFEIKKRSQAVLSLPLYETQAMAFILVTLKLIYILDDEFEEKHSEAMKNINILLKDDKIFVWLDWKKQLSLKEFLFTKPSKFELSLLDSLSLERIISRYPIYSRLRLDNEHDKRSYRSRRSRKGIQSMLEGITRINTQAYAFKETSYPLRYQLNHLIKNWRSFPYYRETDQIDFSFIAQDFSGRLLFHQRDTRLDPENEKLIRSSLSELYECTAGNESAVPDMRRTTSKYWTKTLPRELKTDAFVEKLPTTFSWLMSLTCKITSCYCRDMYREVLKIEDKLIKKYKKT